MEPSNPVYLSMLARMLATAKDRDLRDGRRAVTLASKACEKSQWHDSDQLMTLAAAYAESGNFAEAIRWQTKALKLAPYAERPRYYRCLMGFRAGQPFRE